MLFVFSLIAKSQDSEPIFFFPFNGNTIDETGNGNDAINYGATLTTDRFGNENSAYYFDGVSNFMEIIPKSEELKNMTDFTISLWYKRWLANRIE